MTVLQPSQAFTLPPSPSGPSTATRFPGEVLFHCSISFHVFFPSIAWGDLTNSPSDGRSVGCPQARGDRGAAESTVTAPIPEAEMCPCQ